jgi:hypothetical protein
MTVKVMEHKPEDTKLRFEPSGLPPLNKIIIPRERPHFED